jgi:hypothetical protein
MLVTCDQRGLRRLLLQGGRLVLRGFVYLSRGNLGVQTAAVSDAIVLLVHGALRRVVLLGPMPLWVWTPLLRLHQYVLNPFLLDLDVFLYPQLRAHRLFHIQYFFIFEVNYRRIFILARSLSTVTHFRQIVPRLRRKLGKLRLFGTSTLSLHFGRLQKRVHKLGVVQHLHVHLVVRYAIGG